MTDIPILLDVPQIGPAAARAATLAVCGRALDPDDALLMLQMLGLTPSPDPPKTAKPETRGRPPCWRTR